VDEDNRVTIPPKFYFSKRIGKNCIDQLKFPKTELKREDLEVAANNGSTLEVWGRKVAVRKAKGKADLAEADDLLMVSDAGYAWAETIEFSNPKWNDLFARRREVMKGLCDSFKYIEETRDADHAVTRFGLRPPQVGAIHSVLGHLKMSSEVATIVMPTGTGKTDSMVGLMALLEPSCLLVVVPTDALRTQLGDSFRSLGVLKRYGLVPMDSAFPTVGLLKSRLEGAKETEVFCEACNVVVTTMSLLGTFDKALLAELSSRCSHLFIDEAHHVKAVTWDRVRSAFGGKPTIQFTATPYRNDGKHVDGRMVFNYPLFRAQKDGYFKKITLKELWVPVDSDEAVAKAAVSQLKHDLALGFDHIVMARTAKISKATNLEQIYQNIATEFAPVVVHSQLTRKELDIRVGLLQSRKSRVAICVSMFGEGFDLPELKIAALHDIHQSLAVTIQFAGRFTRGNPKVGDATIIVNRADAEINDSVRALYAEGEGTDWNQVLRTLTEGANKIQIEKEDFFHSFPVIALAIPIQNISPKMSTVVYRTEIDKWNPWNIEGMSMAKHIQGKLSVSLKENIAFFVTVRNSQVDWADASELVDRVYDLFALFWDPLTRLLYINSSDNSSVHEDIGKAVCGDTAELIRGVQTFRVMDGINRLTLRNMGLNDRLLRSVRFTMFSGSDVRNFVEGAKSHGKETTHVFGDGFDGTSRVTIGTSKKGRIWSWKEAKDLLDWTKWCKGIGAKLLDSSIKPDTFLQDWMVPEEISKTPNLHPILVEWPDYLYRRAEESVFIQRGDLRVPFFNVGIELIDPAPNSPIKFAVVSEKFSAVYRLIFNGNIATYAREEGDELLIAFGKRTEKLADLFGVAHPIVRYEKDCFSQGTQLLRPSQARIYQFDPQKIVAWNWDGVDPTKESQTVAKFPDSVQGRTIQNISAPDWDIPYSIIFDDDAPGEAADIVAMVISAGRLKVDLFHCKFSKKVGGKRVNDLFVVCGQAQRSRKWRDDIDRLFTHLASREKNTLKEHAFSRFQKRDFKALQTMRFQARSVFAEFRVFVIQPGLSRADVSADQCEILGTTKLFLNETAGMEFLPIGTR
jgi:superfamily II DNA or RNA helicase